MKPSVAFVSTGECPQCAFIHCGSAMLRVKSNMYVHSVLYFVNNAIIVLYLNAVCHQGMCGRHCGMNTPRPSLIKTALLEMVNKHR